MENNTLTNKEGKMWTPAKPEPYYSNFVEKMLCFFGFHAWPRGSKTVLKRVRAHLKEINMPEGDEARVGCYRCDKTLN